MKKQPAWLSERASRRLLLGWEKCTIVKKNFCKKQRNE
jgi:hypothetical protein